MDTSPPHLAGETFANGADWQIATREAVTMIDTCHFLCLGDGSAAYLQTVVPPRAAAGRAARIGQR